MIPRSHIRRTQSKRFLWWSIWLGVLLNVGVIFYSMDHPRKLLTFLLTQDENHIALAQQAFHQGDWDNAIDQAQIAYTKDITNTQALIILVRTYIYRSYVDFQYDTDRLYALELTHAALGTHPTHVDTIAIHAFALQANDQAINAIDFADQALQITPNHTLARTALALAYARIGSFETALYESQLALNNHEHDFDIFDTYRAIAISLADLGRYDEARIQLTNLIENHPQVIPLYYERALYSKHLGKISAAEADYFQVLTLDPENIKARLRLCELANYAGEQDSALQYCQQVVDKAPSLAKGWYQLGRIFFLAGDFQQAQQTLNRCSTLQIIQDVPLEARTFECWYLQGQAAEILKDCDALTTIYNQFQIMTEANQVNETWIYPPEGPPVCAMK